MGLTATLERPAFRLDEQIRCPAPGRTPPKRCGQVLGVVVAPGVGVVPVLKNGDADCGEGILAIRCPRCGRDVELQLVPLVQRVVVS